MIKFLKMKLQNKALRWLCIILAAVAVFGMVAAATGHLKKPLEEEEDEDILYPNVILISDCESVDGFKRLKFGGNFVSNVNKQYKTQGFASVGGTYTNISFEYAEAVFSVWYQVDKPVDISDMTHYVFDIYVDDPSAFNGCNYTIELNSADIPDKHEIQTKGLLFTGLVEGWNTVEVPLTSFTSQIGSFDPTNFTGVRFYSGGVGTAPKSGQVYFDNIRFVKEG